MFRRYRYCTVALAALLTLAGCGSASTGTDTGGGKNEPIKIGAVLALTGANASYGVPEQNAAKVVVDDINAKGGIGGRKVELTVYNDQSDTTMAARGAQELISKGVIVLIGSTRGSGTLAMAPIAKRAAVPIISVASTSSVTSKDSDYYGNTFRAGLADQVGIPAIFNELVRQGHKRIAIFAQNDAYGKFGTDLVTELAGKSPGVKVVGNATADLTATDVAAQATRIRNANPDAVVLQVSSVGLGAAFLRAAKANGLTVPMFAGLGVSQNALLDNAKGATDNLQSVALQDPANPTAAQAKLNSLLQKGGFTPSGGFGEVLGGSAIKVVEAAVKSAGANADGKSIRQALTKGLIVDAYGVAPLKFDSSFHDGFTQESIVWLQVRDNAFVKSTS